MHHTMISYSHRKRKGAVEMRDGKRRKIGLIFLIGGILMLVGSLLAHFQYRDFQSRSLEALARIVKVEEHDRGDDRSYTVTIRFDTQEGKEIETELGYYESGMVPGVRVKIFYDPENPQQVMAQKAGPFLVRGLAIMGACYITLGGGLRWYRRKKQ